MRSLRVLSSVLALVAIAVVQFPASAHAQGPGSSGVQVFSVQQTDLDGDGQPDMTAIECSFATEHDRVLVFDGGGNMRVSNNWQEATDFSDDTWVFQTGPDSLTRLVVRFTAEDGQDVAYLYDDQDGDGVVRWHLSDRTPVVDESRYWSLKVESGSHWFRDDGSLNLDLTFLTTSPENGSIQRQTEERTYSDETPWYELKYMALGGAHIHVNESHNMPLPPSEFIFFPLLGAPTWYQQQYLFDTPPVIGINWGIARLNHAGLLGYPVRQGWYINSFNRFRKHEVNTTSFENPQADYVLSQAQPTDQADPDMHIRVSYMPPFSPWAWPSNGPTALEQVSYDWRQRNVPGLLWDYKIDVAGTKEITSVVRFPDFAVKVSPYERLPYWVTEQKWAYATFVAVEGIDYLSTEGIYEWYTIEGVVTDISLNPTNPDRVVPGAVAGQRNYLLGRVDEPPGQYYTRIRTGLRGEYADLESQPYLYFSPIDRKLHLLKAVHGVWNIDGHSRISYANLNGDGYLDQWIYTRVITGTQAITTTRQLNAANTHLIYSDDEEVIIRQAQVKPSLFETLPPTNHGKWVALGEALEANQGDLAPGDFKGMVAQFDGPEVQITGANLRDYRPIGENGFRFVLELQRTFRWSSQLFIAGAGHLQPGHYLLSFNGQELAIQPLTPPKLILGPSAITLSEDKPKELTPVQVNATVRNEGLEDANSVLVHFDAWQPGQSVERIGVVETVFPGEETETVSVSWAPTEAGLWTLNIRAVRPDGTLLAEGARSVEVAPMPKADWDKLSRLMSAPSALALLFVSLAAIAAATLGLVLSSPGAEERVRS